MGDWFFYPVLLKYTYIVIIFSVVCAVVTAVATFFSKNRNIHRSSPVVVIDRK